MKLIWGTDIHLNFLDDNGVDRFLDKMVAAAAATLLLGGDIGEAVTVAGYLQRLAAKVKRPIYFVLGNHDYYGRGIRTVREEIESLASEWLRWLPTCPVVELNATTALVGHGGWGDGRLGDPASSAVLLNDFMRITELREAVINEDPPGFPQNKRALLAILQALGDEAAATVSPMLWQAASRYPRVLFLTHVPPFAAACWHNGKPCEGDWLPYFACEAVGDVLLAVAEAHPACAITVLCGHTHGSGTTRLLPNLTAFALGSVYGAPDFITLALDEAEYGLPKYDWGNMPG